jgi:hypothetical protein
MIEVFKTNVQDRDQADMLLDHIRKTYIDYNANFDLDDCDNILRVECKGGSIQASFLIYLLKDFGYNAEVLADDYQPVKQILSCTSV